MRLGWAEDILGQTCMSLYVLRSNVYEFVRIAYFFLIWWKCDLVYTYVLCCVCMYYSVLCVYVLQICVIVYGCVWCMVVWCRYV